MHLTGNELCESHTSDGTASLDKYTDDHDHDLNLTTADKNGELQVRLAPTSTSDFRVLFDDTSLTLVTASKEESQNDSRLVLGDGPENAPANGFVSRIDTVDEQPTIQTHNSRNVSGSSATNTTEYLDSNLELDYESSEFTIADQGDDESEAQTQECVVLIPEERKQESIEEVEVRDTSSGRSTLSGVPTITSWSAPSIKPSEIPRALKPPKSEISDLGNGAFYDRLPLRRKYSPSAESLQNLRLQDRFFSALVKTYTSKKGFFPKRMLSDLVTKDCVIQQLSQSLKSTHSVRQIHKLADSICQEERIIQDDKERIKSFKRIFAILVLIERSSSISKFVDENVDDSMLPLIKCESETHGSLFELRMASNKDKRLECFEDWTIYSLNSFEEWQWTTVSPFFFKGSDREVKHTHLHESIFLPFTADSRQDTGSDSHNAVIDGGFSRVFKVNIHPDHHDLMENISPEEGKYQFAIKRLLSQSREDFDKEVEMLKRFSYGSHRHRNLIDLLATYEQRGVYYLIFPCAEGDLTYFWSHAHPNPCFDLDTITWVAEQCEGLAEGLLSIHKYETSDSKANNHEKGFGRHGDLKPENILWFPDGGKGVLKISDFGLASFSLRHSRAYIYNNVIAASMCYRAPESDLANGKIGPSYDIWTLGCLYLEFATWLIGGIDLVRKFSSERMSIDPGWEGIPTDNFFELCRPRDPNDNAMVARVKPKVTQFIQKLHRHERCSEFLHHLLHMIECEMLLVKPNDPAEPSRIDAQTVFSNLKGMLKRIGQESTYADKSTPREATHSVEQTHPPFLGISVAEVQYHKMAQRRQMAVQDEPQSQMLAVPSRKRPRYSP